MEIYSIILRFSLPPVYNTEYRVAHTDVLGGYIESVSAAYYSIPEPVGHIETP